MVRSDGFLRTEFEALQKEIVEVRRMMIGLLKRLRPAGIQPEALGE